MKNSKIDWCDHTWNIVTGCLHGCEYCYARNMANRFKSKDGKKWDDAPDMGYQYKGVDCLEFDKPLTIDGKRQPYPNGFNPTYHRYRLDEYKDKKASKIFVSSMGDLFGEWVPRRWIEQILRSCLRCDQHTYLFLTKNPARYKEEVFETPTRLHSDIWFGSTITDEVMAQNTNVEISELLSKRSWSNTFLSIEPLFMDIARYINGFLYDWVIIGAETGTRKDKIIPERKWIENIVNMCEVNQIPVFMKENLKEAWGEELIQEWPYWMGD